MWHIQCYLLLERSTYIFVPIEYAHPPVFGLSVEIVHRAEVFIELLPGCCHGRFLSPEITKRSGYHTALID